MKKLLLVLLSVVLVFSVISCQSDDVPKEEITTATTAADETVAKKSSSDEVSLVRSDISDVLEKLWTDSYAADGIPEALTLEKVRLLTKGNYVASKDQFKAYCNKAERKLTSTLATLPERCVIETERKSGNFASVYEGTTFYILDSSSVTDENRPDLKEYLKTRVNSIIEETEYVAKESDKQFNGVGTVVVHYLGVRWYYFDTATNKVEPLELFPDYTEIKQIYSDLMSASLAQEYEKAVSESATE